MGSGSEILRRFTANSITAFEKAVDYVADLGKSREAKLFAGRDRAVNELMRRNASGEFLSVDDIFRAQWGIASPNGLDISAPSECPIAVHQLEQNTSLKNSGIIGRFMKKRKYAGLADSKNVYIKNAPRPGLLSKTFEKLGSGNGLLHAGRNSTLGHEAVHRLELDPAYGFDMYDAIDHTHQALHTTLSASFIERAGERIARTAISLQEMLFHPLRRDLSTKDYLASDLEMRARVHEILTHGQIVWDAMPADRTELYAALHNLGVKTPPHIQDNLYTSSEGQAALEKFRGDDSNLRLRTAMKVSELNRVYDYAGSSPRRAMLLDQAYPGLYGELLEYYGDKEGRKRMGLDDGQAPVREALAAIANDTEPELSHQTREKLDDLPKDCVNTCLNRMLLNIDMAENDELSDKSRSRKMDAAFQRLVNRPDVKAHLESDESADPQTFRRPAEEHPLLYAVVAKNMPAYAQKLLAQQTAVPPKLAEGLKQIPDTIAALPQILEKTKGKGAHNSVLNAMNNSYDTLKKIAPSLCANIHQSLPGADARQFEESLRNIGINPEAPDQSVKPSYLADGRKQKPASQLQLAM